eukprot:TRINITY_DN1385_c0_g1_i1.p2 TRINITY_DN1385_c0_g1~~TRINITY_DN1385_c0_g1_i1.p2  ORF type:complete len:124 (-),score=14.70 TRINITY_DN1385_c0_g1_i1:727-1098(-)
MPASNASRHNPRNCRPVTLPIRKRKAMRAATANKIPTMSNKGVLGALLPAKKRARFRHTRSDSKQVAKHVLCCGTRVHNQVATTQLEDHSTLSLERLASCLRQVSIDPFCSAQIARLLFVLQL